MKTIEIKDLNNEVTPQEAADVKGGYSVKMKDVLVSSYSVSGSGG